jgi:hypothetical protein
MRPNFKRTVVATALAVTLLSSLAAFAILRPGGPLLTPTAAILPAGSQMQFHVYKSNDRVTEKWWIIQSRADDDEFITANGLFHAGSKPGYVRVYVQTSEYSQPSYASVQVTP